MTAERVRSRRRRRLLFTRWPQTCKSGVYPLAAASVAAVLSSWGAGREAQFRRLRQTHFLSASLSDG